MKIGICTSFNNLTAAEKIGYDYVEFSLTNIALADENAYMKLLDEVNACRIKVEATNCLFPGDMKLIGSERNYDKIKEYLNKAFARTVALGTKICVFGSGVARRVPDGYDEKTAYAELVEVARIAADAAALHGLTIVIEPLNRGEANNITRFSEGFQLTKDVNKDNFKVLCDWYHAYLEGDMYDDIVAAGGTLAHTHIANPDGRICPKDGDGQQDGYSTFFSALKAVGYDGRVSYEGKITEFESEAASTLAYLRKLV